MTSVGFHAAFVLCVLLNAVSSQAPIVKVEHGKEYTLNCDAKSVNWPPNDSGVTDIAEVKISKVVENKDIDIWTVLSIPDSGPKQSAPKGRNWMVKTGRTNNGVNNIETIHVKITVFDGVCADKGVYKCTVVYVPKKHGAHKTTLSRSEQLKFTC